MAPMGQTFTQHPQATHSLCTTTAFLFLRLPAMSIPPRVNMDIMIGRTGVFFRDEITENACRYPRQASWGLHPGLPQPVEVAVGIDRHGLFTAQCEGDAGRISGFENPALTPVFRF